MNAPLSSLDRFAGLCAALAYGKPRTRLEFAHELHLAGRTAATWLRILRDRKLIRIHGYTKSAPTSTPTKQWTWGHPGLDAARPVIRTRTERSRDARRAIAGRREKRHANGSRV